MLPSICALLSYRCWASPHSRPPHFSSFISLWPLGIFLSTLVHLFMLPGKICLTRSYDLIALRGLKFCKFLKTLWTRYCQNYQQYHFYFTHILSTSYVLDLIRFSEEFTKRPFRYETLNFFEFSRKHTDTYHKTFYMNYSTSRCHSYSRNSSLLRTQPHNLIKCMLISQLY